MTYVLVPLPTKGKVPALNETANKYYKEVDFVVVFWCNKSEVKKVAKNYNWNIHIIYGNELKNRDVHRLKCLNTVLVFLHVLLLEVTKK